MRCHHFFAAGAGMGGKLGWLVRVAARPGATPNAGSFPPGPAWVAVSSSAC